MGQGIALSMRQMKEKRAALPWASQMGDSFCFFFVSLDWTLRREKNMSTSSSSLFFNIKFLGSQNMSLTECDVLRPISTWESLCARLQTLFGSPPLISGRAPSTKRRKEYVFVHSTEGVTLEIVPGYCVRPSERMTTSGTAA